MNVQEAVQEITKLNGQMNEAANTASIASTRYDAHMQLYNMACMQGDAKEIESQRLILHSQLDALLDAGFEIYSHKRRIQEIQRTVQD